MDPYSQPPPPYSEEDYHHHHHHQPQIRQDDIPKQHKIARKPVQTAESRPGPNPLQQNQRGPWVQLHPSGEVQVYQESREDERPPKLPPRPGLLLSTSIPFSRADRPSTSSSAYTPSHPNLSALSVSTNSNSLLPTSSPLPSPLTPSADPSASNSKRSASFYVQKAYRDARHFAGGLIRHPTESTKHFTVLRHSHGLVFYQGVSTTLAISIFSDAPLPADRTIWLQSKGWTGTTGMRARALLGLDGSWLNVTPGTLVVPEQLKPEDERAWQRDIAYFRKKGHQKVREKHILRETAVIRIPAEAGDGYFQLVLCLGDKKKVLCPSPSFRILSTSASPHSLRGASLSTLPLELGALALGTYVRNTAGRVVGPATAVVHNRVQKYMPSFWKREAVVKAYSASGASQKLQASMDSAKRHYGQPQENLYAVAGEHGLSTDQGPQPPYPVEFYARGQPAAGENNEHVVVPIVRLNNLPDHTARRLHGYYFGWARPVRSKKSADGIEEEWCQAVITALIKDPSQLARANIAELNSKEFTLHLLEEFDFDGQDAKERIEVRVMGFIRPDDPAHRACLQEGLRIGDEDAAQAALLVEANDISMSQNMLDQLAWGPNSSNTRSESGLGKFAKGYSGVKEAALRSMDRVPLHMVGVRTPVDAIRDRAVITNGYFVMR